LTCTFGWACPQDVHRGVNEMASIRRRVDAKGRARYEVRYRDRNGAEQTAGTYDRKEDAKHEKARVEAGLRPGNARAGMVSFGKFAEDWYASLVVRPSTRRIYRNVLDHQILPHFAAMALAHITMLDVRTWLASLDEAGYSIHHIRNARSVLRLVLGAAVEADRLSRNVAAGIKLSEKGPRKEPAALTPEQLEDLAEAIHPRFAMLIRFTGRMGLRPEELTALKVENLDLLHGTVRIDEAAPCVGGHLVWGPTKTGEVRSVDMPRYLVKALAAYVRERALGPKSLVFTTVTGCPMRFTDFERDYFKPALNRAGLPPDFRFYDLRHTAASIARREGASLHEVSKLLGHAKPSITLNVYMHLFRDEMKGLADRADRAQAEMLEAREARPEIAWQDQCKGGHELTPENSYIGANGARLCRKCIGERNRARSRKEA
jgi:integrase